MKTYKLIILYTALILNEKQKKCLKCARQVCSYSQDVIFAVHNGHVKTSKHILLGITLKSSTSSRNTIDIFIDMAIVSAIGASRKQRLKQRIFLLNNPVCIQIIKRNPELFTGVVYDNFDRFMETTSGKDTLHDTVGIIY